MSIDYSALLYDPVYAELGVPATLTAGTAAEVDITVIDYTRQKAIPLMAGSAAGPAEVRGVGPSATARIYELTEKGIDRDDYMGATLSFNSRAWTVRSYELRGSPMGEEQGEVRFLLKETAST